MSNHKIISWLDIMNLEQLTVQNSNYRKVIYTGKFQVVLMSLLPGEDIPWEVHDGDQFIRVEKGGAKAIIGYKVFFLGPEDFIIIPPNTRHYIKNNLSEPLKLYAIYSSPEHKSDQIDSRQPFNR
jgi:mannose-6-phosphate isomerase-like protein (cupin superfamily)